MRRKNGSSGAESSTISFGAKLRDMRQRLRLKQAALAAMLKISQGYLSRLEADQVEPNRDVLRRIDRLLRAPAARPLLEQMIAAVERSPHIVLLQGTPIGDKIHAFSNGCNHEPESFGGLVGKPPPYHNALPEYWDGLSRVDSLGLTTGNIIACGHLWRDDSVERAAWRTTHIPIHIDLNTCVVHSTSVRIAHPVYEQTEAEWGGQFSIEYIQPS
jgi:transcriptional regulator with XRE-family HTH domain